MNIYEKVQQIRVDLQAMNLKKSGENKFAGYKYYELGDFLPYVNRLMLSNKVASQVTFETDFAKLRLINCEKPDEVMEFTSPMAGATLKGAHDIQNLGAVETYQRRYLYMAAFEIVESDYFDATQGKQSKEEPKQKVKKLSDYMGDKLNEAVAGYASLTQTKNKAVMDLIKKETGLAPNAMTDADGEKVLALLKEWSDKYIEELGV